MNVAHELFHFLKHKLHAINRHGLHSPFVYNLNTRVLNRNKNFACFESLELTRMALLSDHSELLVEDFGAGSRKNNNPKRSVSSIANQALAPAHQAQALFKIVEHFKPKTVLELGTSLGLTTCYLAEANKNSTIYSIEGSSNIAERANETFRSRELRNIKLLVGNFDDVLPILLEDLQTIDLAYIDGNHRYYATMRYVEQILSKCVDQSIVILDDIYWSKEMTKVWEELKADKRFSISLDYYHFGVLFLQKRMTKENFSLYY